MSNETKVSGPVDVLAWLDSLHATTADGAVTNCKWPEAQEARAAVAELIAKAGALNGVKRANGVLVSFGSLADLAIALANVGGAK